MGEIKIRATVPEDAAAITEIATQPSVVWGTLQLPYQTVAGWRKRLEGNDPSSSISLVAEVDGKVVGMIGIFWTVKPRMRHVAHLGMFVHEAFQGQGVGSALMQAALDMADKWIGLVRIELEVYADNERAVKLYRKHGFEVEGCKRMNVFREGTYVNSLMMGRIRPGLQA